jgi:hypothetical protein
MIIMMTRLAGTQTKQKKSDQAPGSEWNFVAIFLEKDEEGCVHSSSHREREARTGENCVSLSQAS